MRRLRVAERLMSLGLVLELALALRVLAADAIQWLVDRRGTLCLFPDTDNYWVLAGTIRDRAPYEVVEWGDIPHFALRTPGYPLFLAVCRLLFGDRPLAARLVQALLGTLAVWLLARLAARVADRPDERSAMWSIPALAALLVAADPFAIVSSALLLSEAVFIPLMIFGLWGLAELWCQGDEISRGPRRGLWALGTGLAMGAAILVRPSWLLFVPAVLLAWVAFTERGRRARAIQLAIVVALGVVLIMAPWWVRNARIYGRFVPTALWMGASLYDGLNPQATGGSDMIGFLRSPEFWPLDEETQDAALRDRALSFARENPGRVASLALVKLARFWSPWPNADTARSPWIAAACALVTLPQFALIAVGVWDRRKDVRALTLLSGPLVYFSLLHMVFASSMRYRIPALIPALVLGAIGLRSILTRWSSSEVADVNVAEGRRTAEHSS